MIHANIRRIPIIIFATLALAFAALAPPHYPAQAQGGSTPAKPTNLATQVSHDSVILTWNDPQDSTITGYVILRRNKAIHEEGVFITVEDDTNSADTTHTDDTVEPSRKYVYRIKAINTAGLSEISSWARAYTPPAKPTGLSASATPPIGNPHLGRPRRRGHNRLRGPAPHSRVDPEGQFSELVSNTGTDAITYTDGTVEAETRYTYRIKAINEHGTSERSRWLHIDTAAAPEAQEEQAAEPPDRPEGLSAAAFHDQVTLTWDNPQDDSITGYVILRRNRDTDAEGHFDELAPDTGTAATTYTDGAWRPRPPTPTASRPSTSTGPASVPAGCTSTLRRPSGPAEHTGERRPANRHRTRRRRFRRQHGDHRHSGSGRVNRGPHQQRRRRDWILVQADPGQWFTITLTGYGEGDHTALETPYQQAHHQPTARCCPPSTR